MSRRVFEIDGLRAIAMTMVIAQHCGLLPFGWTGVWLFFVISGYVITRGFLQDAGRFENRGAHLRDFMLRRAARIIPIYLAYVLVNVLILLALSGPARLGDVPYLLSFTYNWHMIFGFPPGSSEWGPFGHLWTLSIEEQFYLFFPLLALFAPARWRTPLTIALIVSGPALRWAYGVLVFPSGSEPGWRAFAVYAASACHVDAFLLGSLVARLEVLPGTLARIRRPLWHISVAALLSYAAIYVGINFLNGQRGVEALRNVLSGVMFGQGRELVVYSVVGLFAVALLVQALCGARSLRGLKQPGVVLVGQLSYGGYLFHALVLWLIGATVLPGGQFELPIGLRVMKFALAWCITVAAAYLSFKYFETPARRWLLAWAGNRKSASLPRGVPLNG